MKFPLGMLSINLVLTLFSVSSTFVSVGWPTMDVTPNFGSARSGSKALLMSSSCSAVSVRVRVSLNGTVVMPFSSSSSSVSLSLSSSPSSTSSSLASSASDWDAESVLPVCSELSVCPVSSCPASSMPCCASDADACSASVPSSAEGSIAGATSPPSSSLMPPSGFSSSFPSVWPSRLSEVASSGASSAGRTSSVASAILKLPVNGSSVTVLGMMAVSCDSWSLSMLMVSVWFSAPWGLACMSMVIIVA